MSLKTVQVIVGRLLTDEEYRLKFLSDPIHALTMLRDQGVELTCAEVDALIRTDRTLWSDAAARIDPDLQRSSWLADLAAERLAHRHLDGLRVSADNAIGPSRPSSTHTRSRYAWYRERLGGRRPWERGVNGRAL